MKKSTIAIAVLVVLGLSYWGYTSYVAPNTAPTPTPVFEAEEFDRVVSATGEVVPTRWAQLSFKIGGLLNELAVQEGDRVEVGYVLARLETDDLERQIEQAQAASAVSQANLAQVKAGARPEEIAAAQEALAAAQAGVSTARANLASAQAELARLEAGAKPEELVAAQAAMDKAAVALQLAQSEYDKIAWQDGIGATQQAVALQQASDDYESAKANYEALVRGATAEELDIARAAVEAARAQVDVAQAQAGQAKAQLDQLLAGPSVEAIAVAQAQVEQAQTAVAQAQAALQDAELVAPFTGTVAGVTIREGELVTAGQPVMFLGDLSHLRIETTDLNEADIWAIAVGQEVTLTFDGLPEKALSGRVSRIAPMATTEQGGTNYTVVVELDEQDPGLRWGMTAYVDITVQ
ncbi:MAG: HlyD family efflux transporter periplasmic adaptor subunit [Anaerolineae bacterium]|nr:HlyD family efflux transporter periplasmic adaptor subunit [Anaerolineae bacterium]